MPVFVNVLCVCVRARARRPPARLQTGRPADRPACLSGLDAYRLHSTEHSPGCHVSSYFFSTDYLASVAGPHAIEAVLSTLSSGVQVCKECMGQGWRVGGSGGDEHGAAAVDYRKQVDLLGKEYSAGESQYSR